MTEKTPAGLGRRSVRLASVAAAATLAGLLSGPGSAAEEGEGAVAVTYDCPLPAGTGRVSLEVRADFPPSGEAGAPISPRDVALTVGAEQETLAALLPPGTTSVASSATLDVEVSQNDETAQAQWTDFVAPAASLGEGGDVRLVHTGEVPAITVGSPGDVTLTARDLTLELRPMTEGRTEAGTPVSLRCERGAGESGHLVTVPVGGDESASPAPEPSRSRESGGGGARSGEDITVTPRKALALDPDDPCPVPPPEGEMDFSDAPRPAPGLPPVVINLPGVYPGCAYAVGMANVRKLNGAMIINDPAKKPALISVYANKRVSTRRAQQEGGSFNQFDSLANLKLPDAESTFVTFGFQPVSAKVAFTNGPLTISTGTGMPHPPVRENFAVASFTQSLRLYDVKVNGVPLDVGRDCRTANPFKVTLRGDFDKDPKYMNVLQGGLMSGMVDIPAFSGCGVGGEDLDALFTAAISGPDNLVAINQGATCIPADAENTTCPPNITALPGAAPSD